MNRKKKLVQTVGCIVFFVCSIFRLAATLQEQINFPVAELNENDRIINTFVYADGTTPVLMRKGNTDYYIVSDIRGSVRMVVKVSDGNVLRQMDYDAFGKVTGDTNPGYTPFGYAGGIYDQRTDLVRFGARDYFPEAGKWTAEDPIIFLSGDVNYYNYVSNDPVNYIDPTGLSKTSYDSGGYSGSGGGGAAKGWQTIIGEGMKRVNMEAAKRPGFVILNNMPKFTGAANQVTSHMMTFNRQWILQQKQKNFDYA